MSAYRAKLTVMVDEKQLNMVKTTLNNVEHDSNKVLRKAINDVAKQMSSRLLKKADKTYSYKGEHTGKLKKATFGDLTATFTVTNHMEDLQKFVVSPDKTVSNGRTPGMYTAKVLSGGTMKSLFKYGNKGFEVKFQSGHIGAVVRNPSKQMKDRPGPLNKHNMLIESIYGPADPMMVLGRRDFDEKEEERTESRLRQHIEKELAKLLQGGKVS